MNMRDQLARLTRGAAQVISEAELAEKLRANRPLRVKLGVDPTSADLHLGHTIILRKLRDFQELGHQAVLIIGDFTALIGDPSGRSATRPTITREEVDRNAATYREQAFKILDQSKTEIVYNGSWLGKLSFEDVIRLNGNVTLQQLLQREDFRDRIKNEQPIHAHEIQYPIMQAYDSVMVTADVELGGTDQLFNILLGRDLQRMSGLPEQIVLLTPILEGLDGKQKMSKSLGNYVALNDPPAEMFGKLMSISDELMARYYLLLLSRELPKGEHPLEAKKKLAAEIVATYYSREVASKANEEWTTRFSEKRLSETELPILPAQSADVVTIVVRAFTACAITKSRAEANRLIKQGSIQLDGAKLRNPAEQITLSANQILRLDKTHAVRIG
ncbi:MAG: tyrosine--tRNA ligase [Verrucomicrobia bacterium]|nr:MAG: tyrosine--tRNA ligase [Verrucomicrobiota bacterium]PYL47996.1 MAG: tyrosine--tRNA ligase [Verrucomicrobiota bacterium]